MEDNVELQRIGSTRIMTPVEPGVIALQYTDRWSAFDRGSSKQTIPGLGLSRCACAVRSFDLAKEAGLLTHFVRQVNSSIIYVLEHQVPGKEPLSGKVHGRVLDLEWIWRARAKGSLLERLRKNHIKPEELGFSPGTEVIEGTKLPRMRLECTTKFEPTDRHLTETEAKERMGLGDIWWERAWNLISRAVEASNEHYERVGLNCPDGKLELGYGPMGLMIVDVFGTQDENRILDRTGEVFSKDIVRNYLAKLPWKRELDAAKAAYPTDKSKWPEYPILPAEIVRLVSRRYAEVAWRYAGVRVPL